MNHFTSQNIVSCKSLVTPRLQDFEKFLGYDLPSTLLYAGEDPELGFGGL